MKQYYLLELVLVNYEIRGSVLYKTEFTRPYCIIDILSREVKKLEVIYFTFTYDIDYLYEFFNVRNVDEFEILCDKVYNKSNLVIYGDTFYFYEYYSNIDVIEFTIYFSSKNFNKYYNYNKSGILENYNEIGCDVTIYYDKKENKEHISISIMPLFILSRTKNNKEYIKKVINSMTFLHDSHEFSIKEFKNFNTFRELVLHCIELDRKYFFSKYKYLSDKEKLIFNEYYDILIDVAKVIEL